MNSDPEAVTALFVPGDRPDRFSKAVAGGADVVIVDLEDAVELEQKAAALESVRSAIVSGGLRAMIRIVAPADSAFAEQRDLVRELGAEDGFLGVMLAKAEDAAVLREIRRELSADRQVIALIETALGLEAVREIAQSSSRLAFGALDFALDIGASAPAVLDYARARIVVVSRVAGIVPPLDSPDLEFTDLDAVAVRSRRSRAMGFGGQLCIHPAQLDVVRAAFAPTEQDLAWARRVLEAGSGGAFAVDGSMVDTPVLERARRILAAVDSASSPIPERR